MSGLFQTLQPLHRALDYHLERHNLIASNVANVDTPGFRPRELLRADGPNGLGGLRVATTDEAHLRSDGTSAAGQVTVLDDPATRAGNDGNSVSLEREMSKLAANDLRFDGAARMVARQLGMLRYAADGGR